MLAGCANSYLFDSGLLLNGMPFNTPLYANGTLFNSGLYSHIKTPITFNKRPTELSDSTKTGHGDIEHIQYQVSIQVGTNGIGDIAKKHGMETVYYADLERQTFLFGLWQREFIHIYGR